MTQKSGFTEVQLEGREAKHASFSESKKEAKNMCVCVFSRFAIVQLEGRVATKSTAVVGKISEMTFTNCISRVLREPCAALGALGGPF